MVTRYRPREVDYGFDDDVRRPAIGTQAQTASQETERSSPSRLGGNVGMDGRERCLSDEDPMAVLRGRMIDYWGPENRRREGQWPVDRKSTRLNSSHLVISYAVFCLKKKKKKYKTINNMYEYESSH